MVVDQLYVRLAFLVGAVGVLGLLRQPLRYPDKPGSKGFVVVLVAMSLWLLSDGLTFFVPDRTGTLALYSCLLFSISLCFAGWVVMAIEFATKRFPSRLILAALAAFVLTHLALLWTNFFWLHELLYRPASTVENAILVPKRGPLFWAHVLTIHSLITLSTLLFVREAIRANGLRRRQAIALAAAPLPGLAANVVWFTGLLDLPYDLTPGGVAIGGVILTWALYRSSFLDVAPIARRTVIDEMSDAVVTVDEKTRVVDWNPAAGKLFDHDDPYVGMDAEEFFRGVPSDALSQLLDDSRAESQLTLELEGRTRHYLLLISPVDIGQDEDVGRVIVLRDISDIKRREQQLVKQNEYLDEFAGIVSHDLQGPLMEIRGSADMAVNTGDVSHVEHVLGATDRMETLVDDLLQLARTGQQIDATEPVAVEQVAESAWRRVWSPDSELYVETDATVVADPERLQQLLENLFRNSVEHGSRNPDLQARRDAVEHSSTDDEAPTATVAANGRGAEGEDTTVTVTVGELSDGFYVEDDGPGIPPEARSKVFERGYTTGEDGTGLGLSIVDQIVGAHGWSIRVTEGATGGARFEISGLTFE